MSKENCPSAERLFKRNAKKLKEDTGWLILEKNGTTRKATPEEAPKSGSLVDGEGVSPENGTLCMPIPDGRLRKRARR